jgi:hypothetical protein
LAAALLTGIVVFAAAHTHAHAAGRGHIERPAGSEFGLGPRTSVDGHYTAMLEAGQPLRPRQLQTLRLLLKDAGGHAVDGASITIGGGMPQHGHGLPTKPRVTSHLGNGLYEIEGVRFNMGGWWEFSLAITGSAGRDSVTFNLAL